MQPERVAVFLPCHSLDDFPTWLDDAEADDLLSAWTAAWHPALIAATGAVPVWASVETPPTEPDVILGLVPLGCDERFAALLDVAGLGGSRFVRGKRGRDEIVVAAAKALTEEGVAVGPTGLMAEDFHALGLAWLLAELLARRMRSATGIAGEQFSSAVVAAARAAVTGDEMEARTLLHECFATLDATRSRYYPVDVWLLDVVLLAETTLGRRLAAELESPVPGALVATGRLLERIAREFPGSLERLRARIAAGMAEIVGVRDDAVPVDFQLLTTLASSIDRGSEACRTLLDCVPVTFGQCSGGSSAYLPGLLVERGFTFAIWNLFDGTPLPAPGASRIRWQGCGGACIEAVACVALDARAASTVLQLADRIGDAMDHDHNCILQFAHHAGTASPWFDLVRRIGSWTTLLGRFVTPATLLAETPHAGTVADFPADAFPPTLPRETAMDAATEIEDRVAAAVAESVGVDSPVTSVAGRVPPGEPWTPAVTRQGNGMWRTLAARAFGHRAARDAGHVLDNGMIRVTIHPRTGGILSLRAPGGRANLLSQSLAVRSSRAAAEVGAAWESAEERAVYARMVAERVHRESEAEIVSRGTIVAETGTVLGSFTQRISLQDRLALAKLDVEVCLDRPLAGPLFEDYVACRFAWNENDDLDVHRSLHGESIVTERTRFTAPHFIELRPVGDRSGRDHVLIATAGLPWHVRTTPHTVDVILTAAGAPRVRRRLGLGLGIQAPLSVALAFLHDRPVVQPPGGADR